MKFLDRNGCAPWWKHMQQISLVMRHSFCTNPDAAKDVVQDVFLRLWKEPRNKIEGHVRLWLFRVCRNRALEIRRKGVRMKQLEDISLEKTPSDKSGPESVTERQDSLAQILEITQSLPLSAHQHFGMQSRVIA